jgi:hypothetical protein
MIRLPALYIKGDVCWSGLTQRKWVSPESNAVFGPNSTIGRLAQVDLRETQDPILSDSSVYGTRVDLRPQRLMRLGEV